MVKSLNEISYQLMELYRATNSISDSIDIRLFKNWIQSARAQIIKQKLDDPMKFIDEHLVQDLSYVAMSKVDSSVNSNFTSNKYMLLTTRDLPAVINRKGHLGAWVRVAPADRLERNFTLVSHERALVSGNGKFNQNEVYAFPYGKKLGLISQTNIHKNIKYINIRGVFANPIDAYEFANGVSSWSDDYEYPVSESIVDDMINMVVDKKFKLILSQIEDKINNGTDDTTVLRTK